MYNVTVTKYSQFHYIFLILQTTWIVTWPIHLVFLFTIPDCEKPRFKNWFPLTFIMCIVWIGSLSYIVAWMITIIGKGDCNFVNCDLMNENLNNIPGMFQGIRL